MTSDQIAAFDHRPAEQKLETADLRSMTTGAWLA